MMNESQKHALVTGGTRGIGRAVAQKLAEEGVHVMCWYRSDEARARETQALSPLISTAKVDVTDHDQVKKALRSMTGDGQSVDILVHCAGKTRDGFLAGMDDEQWKDVLDTNLNSAYYVCREVVRDMVYHRAGRIVILSSLSGVTGLPGQTNYAASKGGLIAMAKALALEVARYGILVNAVSPGLIATDMATSLDATKTETFVERIPLGRMGNASEVAELVFFLVSMHNTYITGQNLLITGGLYT
ncbi:MAG: SDR family oxidoreductase [Spartobacteria bacterium]|nr:SDR family oxidoreductase [Spartobacteria bacterium]